MNILVLGNGFDIAHGLPTKYTDFLDFCKSFMSESNYTPTQNAGNMAKDTYVYLNRLLFEEPDLCSEFKRLLDGNFWIKYFWDNSIYQSEHWIDFEHEISKVVQSLDNDMRHTDSKDMLDECVGKLSNPFLRDAFPKRSKFTYRKIRDKLQTDLNNLIRMLEIYLSDYVENKPLNLISPDIKSISVDRIVCFNYTDIYSKIYKDKAVVCDYIHGKANLNRNSEEKGMVLGIDEYLENESRNKNTDFIGFKKFFQRIYKQTGCIYQDWVNEIIETSKPGCNYYTLESSTSSSVRNNRHNLYIFGHSLDVTDGDVLRQLILNNNVMTKIYFKDRDAMGQQIANLVKVIGEDELIRRTGGWCKTIEFIKQADMEKININSHSSQ
jgi:hypothetical protein